MGKTLYVLDTNVYLSDANAIFKFKNNDIVIPFKVLEEVDKFKNKLDLVGVNARIFIRTLDKLIKKGNLSNGVRLAKGKGIISVKGYKKEILDKYLHSEINSDNQIIAVALEEIENNSNKKIIVVSKDINVRVKCNSLNIESQDFQSSQIVESRDQLYTGFSSILVDDQIIDQFYNGEKVYLDKECGSFYPNQFIMLVSNQNDKKTSLGRFINYLTPLRKVPEFKGGVWDIKARNKEQAFSLDLLLDINVPIVTLTGTAGTGKTLLVLASGLQQIFGNGGKTNYKRLIVSRPIQPLGKDIGFLPGTMEEKMSPWLAPIEDNLRFLFANDREQLSDYIKKGIIEIEALTYIRGRSISDAFIVIDEAQNLSNHELKTIATRVGENTKIVFIGDTQQIDNAYLNEISNGLSNAVEKFKEYDISGHVTLIKGERSKVATLSSKIL